jgi:hypothetical protein
MSKEILKNRGRVYLISRNSEHLVILTALVQSVIRRLPNSFCPSGRIHGRTHGCKWSLLKIRNGKYKGKHGGAQVGSGCRERERE